MLWINTASSPKKSLGAIRRKAVDLAHFNPVTESQLRDDKPLPLVMEPAADHVDLADWARNNRDYIEQKLAQHGGILFRGFGLKNPQDFERVAAPFATNSTPNTATCRAKALPERSTLRLRTRKTSRFSITTRART